MRKFLSLLLIITMGLFIIPVGVFAESDDKVDVSLQIYVGDDEYEVLEGEIPDHVTYDEDTSTLTLNGFEGESIVVEGLNLTIVLKGENSLISEEDFCLAVQEGTLTIKGDGTLNIENSEEGGIAVMEDLTINGGSINITGDNTNPAIYVDGGDFIMNDGSINVEDCYLGIYLNEGSDGKFVANGGTINIKDCPYGILFSKKFNLNGTYITMSNTISGITGAKEISEGDIQFNSGKFVFEGPEENFDEDYMASAVSFHALTSADEENLIVFNSDNLYIDDPEYDFRFVHYTDGDENFIAIVIGKEGINIDNYIGLIATDVSILPKEKKTYKVTEGDGQKVYQSAKAIKIDAELDKFVALYINDELVDEGNYDLESGSTIIKLKDAYVKKLEAGNYKFRAVFTDGEATGEFTVTTENPETGDNIITYIALLILSIGALVMIRKRA